MIKVRHNANLVGYNTFRIPAKAKDFLVLEDPKDLPKKPYFILGEGANILLTKDIERLVIKNELKGRKIVAEDDESVTIEVASGENWMDLVNWTVDMGWSGLENMAFIPGTVGAALVGNIAAYGGNFEDVLIQVKCVDRIFSKEECRLGYHDSAFKHGLRDIFITSVTIRLLKKFLSETSYHSRYESLTQKLTPPCTPRKIAEAVTKLRREKLPDWRKIGTAGSFFKNPVVKKEKALALQKEISELQIYPAEKLLYDDQISGDFVKIPAGRLLDELGWKGKRIGNVGTWPKHALTVVNHGGATGIEILEFAQKMKKDIRSHFGIELEEEVIII